MKSIGLALSFLLISLISRCQNDSIPGSLLFVDSTGMEISSLELSSFVLNDGKDTLVLEVLSRDYFGANVNIVCHYSEPKIVDSIDINRDGTKEIFIFRECLCSSEPVQKDPFISNIGTGTTYSYEGYEVWDISSNGRLFSIRNENKIIDAVSTSVVTISGYQFDVAINRNGSILLSNLAAYGGCPHTMGKYTYTNGSYTLKKKSQ